MTVQQLIEVLAGLPRNAVVFVVDGDEVYTTAAAMLHVSDGDAGQDVVDIDLTCTECHVCSIRQ